MVAMIAVIVLALVVAGMYWLMRRQPDRRSLWRMALYVGAGTGLVRAVLSSLGWYMFERTGGPLQIPAFALVMMAWPEAAILVERRVTPAPPSFYVQLSLLLVTTTLVAASVIAFVASKRRFQHIR
jgi:NADH:ubiquinone oxidoreductase subunit 6 (subunit J)